jgi:hypothetical protein
MVSYSKKGQAAPVTVEKGSRADRNMRKDTKIFTPLNPTGTEPAKETTAGKEKEKK